MSVDNKSRNGSDVRYDDDDDGLANIVTKHLLWVWLDDVEIAFSKCLSMFFFFFLAFSRAISHGSNIVQWMCLHNNRWQCRPEAIWHCLPFVYFHCDALHMNNAYRVTAIKKLCVDRITSVKILWASPPYVSAYYIIQSIVICIQYVSRKSFKNVLPLFVFLYNFMHFSVGMWNNMFEKWIHSHFSH